MGNSMQVDALCQLLIEKGVITEREFFTKLKRVQQDYESKRKSSQKPSFDAFEIIFSLLM